MAGTARRVDLADRRDQPQALDQLVDAPVAGRGLPRRAGGHPAAHGRVLERLREVAERDALGGQQPLGLGTEQPALERRGERGAVDVQQAVQPVQVERDRRPRSRPPRGSTPPTTLLPPPNGTTATRASAQAASSALTSSAEPGATTASGARRQAARCAAGRGPGSCARRRARRARRGRRARAPPPPPRASRSRTDAVEPRLGQPHLLERDRPAPAPEGRRRARSAASPAPRSGQRRVVAVLAPPPPPHSNSLSQALDSAPCTWRVPAARNCSGAKRAQPRGFWSSSIATRVPPSASRQLDRGRRLGEDPLERRLLDLLAPDQPVRLLGRDAGEVHPHGLALRASVSTVVQASGVASSTRVTPGHQRDRLGRVADHAPDLVEHPRHHRLAPHDHSES